MQKISVQKNLPIIRVAEKHGVPHARLISHVESGRIKVDNIHLNTLSDKLMMTRIDARKKVSGLSDKLAIKTVHDIIRGTDEANKVKKQLNHQVSRIRRSRTR